MQGSVSAAWCALELSHSRQGWTTCAPHGVRTVVNVFGVFKMCGTGGQRGVEHVMLHGKGDIDAVMSESRSGMRSAYVMFQFCLLGALLLGTACMSNVFKCAVDVTCGLHGRTSPMAALELCNIDSRGATVPELVLSRLSCSVSCSV